MRETVRTIGVAEGVVAKAVGVPIVPLVSIGGQENQIYLSRGAALDELAKRRRFPIIGCTATQR